MATAAALLAVLCSARGAAAVTIAEVVATPEAFDGRSVTVVGSVEAALPVGTESGYDLRDGRAKVTVISSGAAPAIGTRLSVTGTVRVFDEGGDEAEANRFPPAIFESAREPAP
jgi:hypothetical protein